MNKIHEETLEDIKKKLINKKRRATIHENLLFEPKYNNNINGISKNDE